MKLEIKPTMNRNENGIALILVLGILAVLAVLATTFAFNMRLEQKAARNYLDSVTTDCIARAGVEYAIALLRNDSNKYDAYTESWHTSFTGSDIDNDNADNDNDETTGTDSKWVPIRDGTNLIGAYAVYVVDELSKININRAGNLVNSGVPYHASNQGWTVSEIDLHCLPNIGDTRHRDIVQYRYGLNNLPGNDSIDDDNDSIPTETATMSDGIDNDGYGGIDDAGEGTDEPDEYIPHNPFDDDVEFATIEQIKLASDSIGDTIFAGMRNLITAHSAYQGQDKCYYSGSWQDRININAVRSSYDFYNMIDNSGYSIDDAQRYAANIIDYGDMDYVPTVCLKNGTTTPYYGIEGLQINEVMCDVSGIPREDDASYVTFGGTWNRNGAADDTGSEGITSTWSWPFDTGGTYVVDIYATDGGSAEGDYTYTIEGVGPNTASGTVIGITITVGADGDIDLSITDFNEFGAEFDSTFDKIVVHAGDFVEVINISELDVEINSNWKIKYGSTSHPLSSVTLKGHAPLTTIFDYLVITNSLHALDYIYGDNDGSWADDYGASFKKIVLNSSAEFLDIANASEAVGLYNNFGGSTDVLIDIAPYSDGYGTQGYGPITQNYSSERPSPIDDSASGNWADSGHINSVAPTDYWCTPGGVNDGITEDSSWHVHDGPYANIGLIGDVPKGTGATVTFDETDIINFADKLTIVAQRLEAEDADTPLPWLTTETGIDGTTRYVAPNNNGAWDWTWTDGTAGGDANIRLFDGDYYLFVCADYPDCDFECPTGTDREVRPNSLAYAGEVTVSSKTFTIEIRGNGSEIPELDYVLLVPKQDSPGRAGRININTATYNSTDNEGVLEGLPGIDNSDEQDITTERETNGPFEEIGHIFDVSGFSESDFASISNLITVRSDIFQIICTARTIQDFGPIGTYEPSESGGDDVTLAEKKIEVIVDRSTSPIRILSWKEITE